ncbi:MAG: hypothetical protein RL542_395 [Bacteroidota bacterium]|jgi:hypothetical protein
MTREERADDNQLPPLLRESFRMVTEKTMKQ